MIALIIISGHAAAGVVRGLAPEGALLPISRD